MKLHLKKYLPILSAFVLFVFLFPQTIRIIHEFKYSTNRPVYENHLANIQKPDHHCPICDHPFTNFEATSQFEVHFVSSQHSFYSHPFKTTVLDAKEIGFSLRAPPSNI